MAGNAESVSDQSKPDVEIKTEPKEVSSPFHNTQKAADNGSSCSATQEKSEKTDNHAQKRKQSAQEDLVSKRPRASILYQTNDDRLSDNEEFYITMLDVPKDLQIDNFLEECCVMDVIDELKNNKRQLQLSFENEADRKKALQKLHDDGIKENIVCAKISGEEEINDNASHTTEIIPQRPWSPSEDIWETDPLGLYGLKPEFLQSLGITPPLDRWVHVTNFRCDKFELRDVMELAGHVLSCSVININKRFAKVQYSHPLEAVQAVSMLNGQMYFGLKLKVYIEKNPKNDIILPKGLVNIGIGLGLHGRPVRDVVRQYEKYARKQNSAINPKLFRKTNLNEDDNNDDGTDSNKTEDQETDTGQFMSTSKTAAYLNDRSFTIKHVEDNDRSFTIKHVEDLNSIDGDACEKDSIKRSLSPSSVKSTDSTCDIKDAEKQLDLQKSQSSSNLSQAGVPGHTVPIRLSQANPVRSYPRPNMPQNPPILNQSISTATFNSAQNQFANMPYHGPPNRMPAPMPNTMTNPCPQPHSFGPSQPFRPQMPGPGPSGPGPMLGPNTGPVGPIQRPGSMPGTAPMQGPIPNTGPGPIRPPSKVAVQLANLPPSTTFPLLCEKLSHCGQVMSLQFTTPGCAIATFGHPSHADRCLQTFNGLTAEGYRIMVTYM